MLLIGPGVLYYLLCDCAAKAMPHEGHIFQAALPNVSDDRVDAVLMSDALPWCLWPVPREGRSIRHALLPGEMAHDALRCGLSDRPARRPLITVIVNWPQLLRSINVRASK
jgi:hypothetical protein